MSNVKIGVFDSGIGGLSVAHAIKKAISDVEVIYKDDSQHMPYGTRSIEEIYEFTLPILKSLEQEGCKVIIVACNTVTTNLIDRLRQEVKVQLIGVEPMVKAATDATKTGVIAICATPRTLSSNRYKWLKETYANGVQVLEPDCSEWSYMIENSAIDREKIAESVERVIQEGADQIVLGCTHYHWIEHEIKDLAFKKANVISPETDVINQLKQVLLQLA
jgi:glutamate racemase